MTLPEELQRAVEDGRGLVTDADLELVWRAARRLRRLAAQIRNQQRRIEALQGWLAEATRDRTGGDIDLEAREPPAQDLVQLQNPRGGTVTIDRAIGRIIDHGDPPC
jgi:hypothetical protein